MRRAAREEAVRRQKKQVFPMQKKQSLERVFHFQNKPVRTLDFFGSLWFVAKDVCEVLRIRTNSIRCVLEEDEVREFNPNDNSIDIGQEEAGHVGRNMLVVSEPGLLFPRIEIAQTMSHVGVLAPANFCSHHFVSCSLFFGQRKGFSLHRSTTAYGFTSSVNCCATKECLFFLLAAWGDAISRNPGKAG